MNLSVLMWSLIWFSEMLEQHCFLALLLYCVIVLLSGCTSYYLAQLVCILCDIVFAFCVVNTDILKVVVPLILLESA